jgi:hypothetical protein
MIMIMVQGPSFASAGDIWVWQYSSSADQVLEDDLVS